MIKTVRNFLVYTIILVVTLGCLTGCSMKKDEPKSIENKTDEEISFVEDNILNIINRYAKKEYIKDDQIDWKSIQDDTEKLNNSLDTIVLDLSETKISNDDLVNFRNELNNVNIAISGKNENELMQRCSYLYSLLPTYLEKYSSNKNEINNMKLKSLVLSSFLQANFLDWQNAKTTIGLAETKYKEMMNDVDYMKEYSYNLNKTYVLLEELKNAINIDQADLSRLKYINFIEKI